MRRQSRPLLAVAFLLALLALPLGAQPPLPPTSPEDVGMSSERLHRLTATLEQYANEGQLAGGVVLVARRGRLAYHQAFGHRDLESRSEMQRDDIFRIASQTKALVSVAIMILQEEGELLISDPVSKYLPAFAETTVAVPGEGDSYEVVPAERPITLRHLLTHTSGFGYGNGPGAELWKEGGIQGWYFADRDEPVAATIERLAALPADAQPGESFVYGYSTDILGAVVEVASGKPLDEFLRTRLFGPLGMNDSHFYLPRAKKDRLATVYSASSEGLTRAPEPGHMVGQGAYLDGPRKSFSGGAGMLSTAGDYGRFLQMMLNGGTLDGVRILAPATVKLMTVNHVGEKFAWNRGTGFGLGFSVVHDLGARGQPGSVGEYGWGGAYHSSYWVDPEQELVVVYLTQIIPAGNLDDHGRLRALIYSAILE
jgi:CubicO group peptidase (beta-lactamase class C family)